MFFMYFICIIFENKHFKFYLFLYYFYVLCHIHFIIFTLQRYEIIANLQKQLSQSRKKCIFALFFDKVNL